MMEVNVHNITGGQTNQKLLHSLKTSQKINLIKIINYKKEYIVNYIHATNILRCGKGTGISSLRLPFNLRLHKSLIVSKMIGVNALFGDRS